MRSFSSIASRYEYKQNKNFDTEIKITKIIHASSCYIAGCTALTFIFREHIELHHGWFNSGSDEFVAETPLPVDESAIEDENHCILHISNALYNLVHLIPPAPQYSLEFSVNDTSN